MNRALVDGWNDVVADGDDVWVLGDFALGKLADTLPLVGELRGRKVLLAGNHDRCWLGHGRRAEGWTERYLEAGFDEVCHGEMKRRIGETEVLLCHFPYRGDSHDQDRYREHRPADRGRAQAAICDVLPCSRATATPGVAFRFRRSLVLRRFCPQASSSRPKRSGTPRRRSCDGVEPPVQRRSGEHASANWTIYSNSWNERDLRNCCRSSGLDSRSRCWRTSSMIQRGSSRSPI